MPAALIRVDWDSPSDAAEARPLDLVDPLVTMEIASALDRLQGVCDVAAISHDTFMVTTEDVDDIVDLDDELLHVVIVRRADTGELTGEIERVRMRVVNE